MAKKLLMGNEAFAWAALEAGVRVVAGYPGTPSSELIETVAKQHAAGVAHGVHVEWSANEKAALELVAGAAYCGARVLFTCKQVGLNVASDALMSLNYVGVRGGTVLFVADDPGPISSQTEQDTRRFASFAKVPVLDPSTPEEGAAMMRAAFELSERYGTPVIVRPTTRICHASTFFDVPAETHALDVPEGGFEKDPRWVIFPRRSYEAHGEINQRMRDIARDFSEDLSFVQFNPVTEGGNTSEQPRFGVVAGGVSAAYAREALSLLDRLAREMGETLPAYRFMQVGTPYPFPTDAAARFAEGLSEIIVFEELDYVLEDELLKLAGTRHLSVEVRGKLTGDASDRGENSTEDIIMRLAHFFDKEDCFFVSLVKKFTYKSALTRYPDALPVRPPVLCAGCPHRGSFYAVKRALGKRDAVLCGDIGCYTLGNAKPLDAVDTCLCMGAGITMAQGFAVVEPHKKHVAFVGDSTFFASGLTGIVNAVYNGHDITVTVLDNATTAMTGSQPHPGTGVTLMGHKRKPVSIEGVLRAIGVECITFADPLNLAEAEAAAREAIDFEGPSAIIFRSPCIQLKKPDPAVHINTDACTGCKKCITEIGCPAIGFDFDATGARSKDRGQALVNETLCDGCGLCVQVCPFDAIAPAEGGTR
ncbi:indolepyruvate ferredoxin oxidoreductase subunit alpha [Adlercreutzia sp. ZJ138]|uniref:indolepyruvate ferredoxin oxidoreductase subunit alpha n=1 Tax=Adlercreutzia sp. ZJ138 TaxID=2709405 RepID=UPI0013EC19AE|nr:indolepyruvate ferredoxin oxidoreductase subunit alpha [Adlercreutzia sp. ZJ138]